MSKLSDSSCYRKITQSTTTFMKKLSRNKVIWMDENALEVTDSAYDGNLWCQVMPFQVQSYLASSKSYIYTSVLETRSIGEKYQRETSERNIREKHQRK